MANSFYCPRCGKRSDPGVSFCRTCGLSLAEVLSLLESESGSAPEIASRPNARALRIGIGLFLLGTVFGLAQIVLREFDLFPPVYGKIVFISFIIAGILTIAGAVLFSEPQYIGARRTPAGDPARDELGVPITARLNAADADDSEFTARERVPVEQSSVTEDTTRHL